MLIGLGTDICEIDRIERVLERTGQAFAARILTPNELVVFTQTKQPARYLAKRFAVKEAASKALGTGIAKGVSFQDFAVANDELGKPILNVSGVAKQLSLEKGIVHYHISISDEKHYAVATVIAESA
ncbi:Holo-[acyl-carrier-protein] synthase [Vibrio palustris]|uniref:Holo-[acyl-carrier-protein] synthase n=2 Tax=Vibrio palustris TaxID=1918946 RepID=A0A1R4B8J8_9VIBR|nr:Holo-[acyl-carrier-protein] synthase [Vibrio palustris]